jgi:hypothetical protein
MLDSVIILQKIEWNDAQRYYYYWLMNSNSDFSPFWGEIKNITKLFRWNRKDLWEISGVVVTDWL